MVYEMNKSFVTKVLIMSTVLMAGILIIPTNIHDAKANPCSNIHCLRQVETVPLVEVLGLLGMVELVELREWTTMVDLVELLEMLEMVQMARWIRYYSSNL